MFANPQAEERVFNLGLIKNKNKCVIIGHATDTKTFKPLNVKKIKDKAILLSVGGLYRIKGHHLIIKALKKVIERGYNAELWVVGKGYYKKQLVKFAKKLGIEGKVKFLGKKDHEELARIYNISDIFVLANYQEITPAVNEAMSCGKPVVVMECGGRDFVVPDESYGLVARRFDVEDMAKKIIELIGNKEMAKKMAKKGRKWILKNFSISQVAKKVYGSFTIGDKNF